jgi:hypothetical protein
VLITSVIICAVACVIFGLINVVFEVTAASRLRNADPSQLLHGCRQMMANYTIYSNEWHDVSALREGEKGLSFLDEGGRRHQPVPPYIHALHPLYVRLDTNCVMIRFFHPSALRLIAVPDGYEKPKGWPGTFTPLTNGLWLVSGG